MTTTAPSTAELYDRLVSALRPRKRVLTAFSGGVDSTVVAAAARRALGRENAPAAIGDSASLARAELDHARALARELDIDLIEVHPGEQDDPSYQANSGDRCYFCKTHLYSSLHAAARERGITWIANGTNTDDLGDYRPGLKAASEAGVISPLIEAGLDKSAVRAVATHMGISNAEKPASPCLASRLPTGTPVTLKRLSQVERAEALLAELGFRGFRVRHQDHTARLEVPWDQVSKLMDEQTRLAVVEGVKAAGYRFVALDLEGFRSGSGNIVS